MQQCIAVRRVVEVTTRHAKNMPASRSRCNDWSGTSMHDVVNGFSKSLMPVASFINHFFFVNQRLHGTVEDFNIGGGSARARAASAPHPWSSVIDVGPCYEGHVA